MEEPMKGAMSKEFKSLLRCYLWITLLLFLAPVLVSNIFKNPESDDLKTLLNAALATSNEDRAEQYAFQMINREPNNPSSHLIYLWTYFENSGPNRDDTELLDRYRKWAQSDNLNQSDIGNFGLGTYYLQKKDGEQSLNHLNQVQDINLRSLHVQIGRAFTLTKDFKNAEQAFLDEIKKEDGNIARATRYLAHLYDTTGDYSQLNNLYCNEQFRKNIPNSLVRNLAFKMGRPLIYAKALFGGLFDSANYVGVVGACLILIVWSVFLRRLDVFEPEKLRYVLLTLFMGMLATFLCLPLYDFAEIYLGFTLNGNILNDLIYCVFGIGLFEELVKILPLIIMIKLTRQVNESIDFVIYASLSALAFSFIENIGYFDKYSLSIINERGMICSTGHMFYSSLVVYGYIRAYYKKRGSVIGNLAFFFFLAILIHGLYDFFLVCDGLSPEFRMISLLIIVLKVVFFVHIINNTLNQSEFFDPQKANQLISLKEFLGISLACIVLFEYVILSYKYGPELINLQFLPKIGLTWLMVCFYAMVLGTYQLRQGHWMPLKKECVKIKQGK